MPFNPNTPRSRDEVLLQAIVSGDSSAIGDPRDREEEFVKAIADKETLPDYSEASEGDVLQIGTDGPEWGAVPDELPAIAAGDAGKVLKVNSGETGTEWGSIPDELPAIAAGDAGKVLKVNSGETGTEWGSIPNELPAIAAGDAGKVLKVNSSETGVEWGEGGSAKKYLHTIKIYKYNTWEIVFNFIDDSPTAYTKSTLQDNMPTTDLLCSAVGIDGDHVYTACIVHKGSSSNSIAVSKYIDFNKADNTYTLSSASITVYYNSSFDVVNDSVEEI